VNIDNDGLGRRRKGIHTLRHQVSRLTVRHHAAAAAAAITTLLLLLLLLKTSSNITMIHNWQVPTVTGSPAGDAKRLDPAQDISQLPRPEQAQKHDERGDGDGGGPVGPLVQLHVAHVLGVHAKDAGDGADGQKDDGDDGEGVDGAVVAVFGRFRLVAVLPGSMTVSLEL